MSEEDKRGRKPGSYKWCEIQDNIAYYEEFEKPKILYRHFATVPEFTYDTGRYYSNGKSYIIPTKDLSLLGLLNSSAVGYFISQLSPPVRGGFHELRIIYLEQVPIPSMTAKQKESIANRVEKIVSGPGGSAVPRIEREIDELVYKFYGLTTDEIKIIESKRS